MSDYESVKRAMEFSIGPVGIAAITSSTEASFRKILRTPTAAVDCRRLVSEATTVGQLYGILGLKTLHDPMYEKVVSRYQSSRSFIQVAGGCTIAPRPVAEIAKLIDSGEIK